MKVKYFIIVWIIAFLFSLLLLVIAAQQKQQTQSIAAAPGPLRVNPSNPRYFTDGSGKAVYLTGSHNWHTLLDGPSGPFDYTGYLDAFQKYNHNFIRLWTWESLDPYHEVGPLPWQRPGPGNAQDGKPKFNLRALNQEYFDKLRSRVIDAQSRGIYVSIMLFEGWELQFQEQVALWHPFLLNNNINSIDGDPNKGNKPLEVHTLDNPAITEIQDAYVRKVIDTVNDLDNVLYEIANESPPSSTEWQYHMINLIKTYESGKPKKHPVGMTFQYQGGTNAALFNSQADWISPASDTSADYLDDPPPADGTKVIIADTDHISPTTVTRSIWTWKAFTRGLNPIFMDDFGNEGHEETRKAMGYTLTYANKMNLAAMTPQGNLSSTTYALVKTGAEYLVYQPGSGAFTVTLDSGTYAVEWFNPATGQASSGGTVNGTGSQTFTPPFTGDAVLYLKNTTITGTPSAQPSSTTGIPPSPTKVVPTFVCEGHCPSNTPEPSPSRFLSPNPGISAPPSALTPPPTSANVSGQPPANPSQNPQPTGGGGGGGIGDLLQQILELLKRLLELLLGIGK